MSQNSNLDILRHSTAHLLAHAIKTLYPDAKLAIGPSIEDGFYYDFSCPTTFSETDLPRIEEKMHEIASLNLPIIRKELSREEALALFSRLGESYKVELINALSTDQPISVYEQGDFVDLCLGPHVKTTKELQAFKLTKLAGAYWRGDSKNEMLQRIYGTAWANKKDLDAYLKRLEEAAKRDHRLLAKKMDLFHLEEESPGMAFWHPNGWVLYKLIKDFIARKASEFGYQEISTPIMLARELWEKSGHWDKYSEVMFTTGSEERLFAIKPMNCPGSIELFKQGLKSYRDLPIRYSEFTTLHRNEHSGTLHGILRVREFVQDDGHIFCTEEQIESESLRYLDELFSVYSNFGFHDIIIRLSTRPEKRTGSDETWDKAEKALTDVLNKKGAKWELQPGEGAFYGPKIEFSLKDSLGRVWQCGTLQLDLSMPARLGAYYIAEDGSKKTPVMLHRAMIGSLERFIGILLEETAGNLPLWLSPVQAVILNITDNQIAYAEKVHTELKEIGLRVNLDLRNEKIGFKIRQHAMQRVPYQLVVGDKEMQDGTIAVRDRDGKNLGAMSVADFVKIMGNYKL